MQHPKISGRDLPNSPEAEESVLSCCLLDGAETIARCLEARLEPAAFYLRPNQLIYEKICQLHRTGKPVDVAVLAEELKASNQLTEVGGIPYLTQVSGRMPTTAQAVYFIEKVRELAVVRQAIKTATAIVEQGFNYKGGIDDFKAGIRQSFDALTIGDDVASRSITDFEIPADNDPSILLGNRYLNRGDGAVLVSTSGMGKSSMTLQAAVTWALGRAFFGVRPNGPLTSLIVQAEDSDGDIAEIWQSIRHCLNLTPAEEKLVNQRVIIVTDRVHRGPSFINALSRWTKKHKPDLVWINPLLAFMDGDINEASDAGRFLREGLNGLNEPPSFGYIVVHHTSKPPTSKERSERKWNEVMYEMAGSADLTNWARAVLSLRPAGTEGEFNLVLSKRGRRAGVVKEVEQGAGLRFEPITTIPLKHATGTIQLSGRAKSLPTIFWEVRSAVEEAPPTARGGRPKTHTFAQFASVFPTDPKAGLGFRALHRAANDIKPISRSSFDIIIEEALSLGLIMKNESDAQHPSYYRPQPNQKAA